jgi:molybdopterin/thiamine biosynthesis adenylyltransferase/nitroreductase
MSQISEVGKVYLPVLLDRKNVTDLHDLNNLVQTYSEQIILDQFASQKKELFKIQNPKRRLSEDELNALYDDWKADRDVASEGMWVFYPWSRKLIHILDREEFIQLRTSRNQYKISKEEQDELRGKTIGIIGLSVGSAVALTMATERMCGKLKLADFDTIELSNLNRLKTGIQNIGLNKCVVTAREIAEIDPFIEIECYQDGITETNIDRFLTEGGNLDILVDECDEIEIKIRCRVLAKEQNIPVVMETSDRGMLDVERFDLNPSLPIFHGLLEGFPVDKLQKISPQDRIPLVMRIVDVMKSSYRARLSLIEMGQTITTWPQLASAVTLGGAVVTDVCRRILLGTFSGSGRFYVDLEQIISVPVKPVETHDFNPPPPGFDIKHAIRISDSLFKEKAILTPKTEDIEQIVQAGSMAPSSGNDQPWKWIFNHGKLHLFHDKTRSSSFDNFKNRSAELSLGAAYENAILKARQLKFNTKTSLFPNDDEPELAAIIDFLPDDDENDVLFYGQDLASNIYSRSTNRARGSGEPIPEADKISLKEAAESVSGVELQFITDQNEISEIGGIVGACDLISMLNEHGHHDFFERDINWAPTEHEDGISIGGLGIAPAQLAALSMIRDKKVANTLRIIGGGNGLIESTRDLIKTASGLAVVAAQRDLKHKFFVGGIAVQRFWLRAEQLGYAIQPLNSPLSLFARLDSGEGLEADETDKLYSLKKIFRSIVNLDENLDEIFLFKIAKTDAPTIRTNRLPLNKILFMANDEI